MKDSCASKDKKVGQKKLIHSMFCCFGRPKRKFVPSKCNLQEEKWLPALPEKTETTLPPTPAIPNAHSHESDVEVSGFLVICHEIGSYHYCTSVLNTSQLLGLIITNVNALMVCNIVYAGDFHYKTITAGALFLNPK